MCVQDTNKDRNKDICVASEMNTERLFWRWKSCLFIVINLREDAEMAMMVSPVFLYKTLLCGHNKEEEDGDNDVNNAERGEGCFPDDVCPKQHHNGQSLSSVLGLLFIDNRKDNNNDNKGANKEAYCIAKNLLYRIGSNKDLMGPREKPQLVWSKRYAST